MFQGSELKTGTRLAYYILEFTQYSQAFLFYSLILLRKKKTYVSLTTMGHSKPY